MLTYWLTDNRYRADIRLIGKQSISVDLYIFTECVKPIVEKIHTVEIIYIGRGCTYKRLCPAIFFKKN